MASRPEIISLNDFIKIHREAFASYELWLSDELTEFLIVKRDLEKPYTSIVIDIDEDEPVYGVKDSNVQLRFNGRFYIPVEDKNVKPLNMKPEQWVELFQQWFDEKELEVVIGDIAKDLIKFTAIIPALQMPEGDEEGGESEEGTDSAPEKTTEEGGEAPVGEEAPETDETGGESEKEESEPSEEPEAKEAEEPKEGEDKELKEFEEALGL